MERRRNNVINFKLVFVWLAIFLLTSFWLTMQGTSQPVSMVVAPEAPRMGEPVIATFRLNNPSSQPLFTRYQFYANGELLKEGATTIARDSNKTYQYAYRNPLRMGEQINFLIKTQSEKGNYEESISSPPYPPQIWSSFVSFASFSTSVLSSMSTMTYYQTTFGENVVLNTGFAFSVILILLLIFLELSQTVNPERTAVIARLRLRYSTVTWILFTIFLGILYTKIIMMIA